MFLPSQAPVSVLDAPCQITVEFTDYASYQHHQLRQQQYREELERQQIQQEQQRHRDRILQQQQQQLYQQPYPPHSSPCLPQQLPPDQRLLVYQQQQQQQQQPPAGVDVHGNHLAGYRRSDGASVPLIGISGPGGSNDTIALSSVSVAPAVSGAAYSVNCVGGTPKAAQGPPFQGPPGGSPPEGLVVYPNGANSASPTAIKQEEQHLNHILQGLQHYPAAPPVGPGPALASKSPSNNASHSPAAPPPALAATTASVPVVAPVLAAAAYPASTASTASSSQSLNSGPPTFLPPTVPPPPPPPSASNNCAIPAAPASTGTVASGPVSSSPVARQLHLRRQHHPNHNNHAASHHHHHQHLQQQIQRRRIVKAQSFTTHPAAVYTNNASSPPNGPLHHPHHPQPPALQQPHQQLGPAVYASHPLSMMADGSLPKTDADRAAMDAEIAAQEAAARDYRPDVNGPGINEIRSTEEIKDHYASADHIFVQKTVNLPRAYPLYRAVRGDGNCGWRAIGFCYFEALIYNNNIALINEEKTRLHSLNDYIRDVGGYDPYVYEDMVEETDILFDAILKALPDTEQAIRVLTESFNDDGAGNAIIYHLRLLTASYLKGNVGVYEGFIAHDGGVIGYCQEWIERPNCEIDHLRVEVLASILLKPSDIVLEIAYLDRSHGSAVSVYKFPDTNIGRMEETISMRMSLLFRPDHYDILYRPSLPSKAVAEATLLRFLPTDAAMAALQPPPDMAAAGASSEQQPPADLANPLVAPYLPADSLAADIVAQTFPAQARFYERIVQQTNTPSIREDTPDLTPGSSSNSPAMIPVKEEPITPAYASPASPNSVPAAHRDAGAGSALSVTPTAPTPASIVATNSGAQRQTVTPAAPTVPAPSIHDREVHHVGSISYGSATQSIGRLGNFSSANFQVLSQLPGFGRFQSHPASSPLGPGPSPSWNIVGPAATGFNKGMSTFSVSPVHTSVPPTCRAVDLSNPPISAVPASPAPSVIPGTPMSTMSAGSHMDRYSDSYSEPDFSAAGTPAPTMDIPTPVPATPMPYGGHPGNNTDTNVDSGGGGSGRGTAPSNVSFLPEPKSTPVRFTKWHFNRLPHDATDPSSSLFRNSRISTAHFDNPDFQPQEYDPSGGSEAPSSSRNRRKRSVLREDDSRH